MPGGFCFRSRVLQFHPVPPIAQIHDLDFAYGQQLVLKHINLTIERGSILGVIGPNGGGKTTLLRLLLGLHEPTRGAIAIEGLAPRDAVRRGNLVGYLPQHYPVNSAMPLSVRQLVRLGLAGKTGLLHPYRRDDLDFVESLLERVGVQDLADRPFASISGGQRQRAMIARALAPRPSLLLLDEPTTGIDRSGQARFIEFLTSLHSDLRLTIVLVSHDLRAVTAIAHRIACLNLTLHYHDVPEEMPPELADEMFGCDLAAMMGPRHRHPKEDKA